MPDTKSYNDVDVCNWVCGEKELEIFNSNPETIIDATCDMTSSTLTCFCQNPKTGRPYPAFLQTLKNNEVYTRIGTYTGCSTTSPTIDDYSGVFFNFINDFK